MNKYFKTLDEQVEILKDRGLIIDDENRAKEKLFMYNYYKLVNGTRDFFTEKGDPAKYRKGVRFDDLIDIHEFDKVLKKNFLDAILDIERHLRSIISYVFMKYHNEEKAYLNPANFDGDQSLISANSYTLEKTISNFSEEKNYTKSINYYVGKYNHVPFWFLVNFISFGKLVNFYQTMKQKEKEEVANEFSRLFYENLAESKGYYITPFQFESFITNIKEIRNVVAHDNMILSYLCDEDVAYIGPIHSQWKIAKEDSRNNVFNVYLIMQIFLSKSQYRRLTFSLQDSIANLKESVDDQAFSMVMKSLGFPLDF